MKKGIITKFLAGALAAACIITAVPVNQVHAGVATAGDMSGQTVNINALGSTGTNAPVYSLNNKVVTFDYVLRYKLTDLINIPKTKVVLSIDPDLKPYVDGVKVYGNTTSSKKGVTIVKDHNGDFVINTKDIFQTGFIGYNQYSTFEIILSDSLDNISSATGEARFGVSVNMINQKNAYVNKSNQVVTLQTDPLIVNEASGTYTTAAKLGFQEREPQANDTSIKLLYELQSQVTLLTFANKSYYVFNIDPELVPYFDYVNFESAQGKKYNNVSIPSDGKIVMDATSLYPGSLAISVPYTMKMEIKLKNGLTTESIPGHHYTIYASHHYADGSNKAGQVVDHTLTQVGIQGLGEPDR